MPVRTQSKRNLIGAGILAAAVAIGGLALVQGDRAEAADAVAGDGTTTTTAGASCWGIKQQFPASPDGTYWLNTALLARPQQFHCDMTTDGGGWVLVGRGRQGWSFNPLGQGSAATVRATVAGQAAFAPAALDTETIDALLNGTDLTSLPEGIRLERSTNAAGTTRQDLRLFPQYRAWTWSFPAGQLLTKVTIDGTTYQGSNTADTAATAFGQTTNGLSGQSGLRRMFTTKWKSHNDVQGFSFGAGVNGGSNAASNHLWTNSNEGSPIPFTRVWVRPRIANDAAGFTPLPSAGLPASPRPAVLKSRAEVAPWGVVGMDHTGEATIEPWKTNVLGLETAGNRTFVGGRFTGVQNGPSASPVAQPYLAAFDLDGTFIDTFRPKLDGRVHDLVQVDGKLLIAGDFTNVDGAPNTAGIAALDPATGKVIAGYKASATRADGTRPLVRALDVRGGTVYAAGSFNRFTGGTWNPVSVSSAISFDVATGTPGPWRPRLNGSAVDLDVAPDGSRVSIAGYFTTVNGDANQGKFAITDAATGTPSAGIGPWTPSVGSGTKTYQQAVADLGDRTIVGGSEHNIQLWDRNRTRLLDASVTKQGGDTQAIEVFDDTAYIGCHCGNWVYQGTNNFSSPTGFRSIDAINLVAAFDPTTLEHRSAWYPSGLKGASGEGVWAIDRDERGCLWVGGDLNRSGWSGVAANDWVGGFARFCPNDTTVPTPPSKLAAAPSGSGAKLTWTGSTDDSGTVSYDVYRNDRVIATVWGTSFTDPVVDGVARYTVRAVDARGNRSAAPAPIAVGGPAPKIDTALAFGSTWQYQASGTAPAAGWAAPGFDAAGWATGPAKLGWGVADLGTTLATKPQTFYARSGFTVADPSAVRLLEVKVTVATGAVVYVNGIEAGRINMPAGKVGPTTPASGYVWGAAEATVHTLAVPATLLRAGQNAVAVEVHSMTAGASRAFVDLEATTYGAGGDTAAPSAPALTATAADGRVDLSWAAASDDIALGGYLITRDDAPLAVVGPMATSYVDGDVDTTTPHTYGLAAFDTNGNVKAASPVTVGAKVNANLLGYGSTWRWTYPEAGLAAGWAAPGFDDAAWASGPAELGFGDSDERTIISTGPSPRPITAYFRTTVEVADPAAFTAVLAELVRDDGAVIYVNGVEVARENLPTGPIDGSTKASTGIADRAAEKAPVAISIPTSAFRPGTNVVAVELHNADRASGDLSFDLKLTGQPR